MQKVFDRLSWKTDKKLFQEVRDLLTKKQYEDWVIFRFGCIMGEMENIDLVFTGNYPDAILYRLENEEIVDALRIEFEEYSSDFKAHGHDPSMCDLIVCGIDDWKEVSK
jgi:hypothetical protein